MEVRNRAIFLYIFNGLLAAGIILSLPAIIKVTPTTQVISKVGIGFFSAATGSLAILALVRLCKFSITRLKNFKLPRVTLPTPSLDLSLPWLRLQPSFYWKRISISLRRVKVKDGARIKFPKRKVSGFFSLLRQTDEKTLLYTAVALSVTALLCLIIFVFTWKRLLLGHNGLDMFDILGGF